MAEFLNFSKVVRAKIKNIINSQILVFTLHGTVNQTLCLGSLRKEKCALLEDHRGFPGDSDGK